MKKPKPRNRMVKPEDAEDRVIRFVHVLTLSGKIIEMKADEAAELVARKKGVII